MLLILPTWLKVTLLFFLSINMTLLPTISLFYQRGLTMWVLIINVFDTWPLLGRATWIDIHFLFYRDYFKFVIFWWYIVPMRHWGWILVRFHSIILFHFHHSILNRLDVMWGWLHFIYLGSQNWLRITLYVDIQLIGIWLLLPLLIENVMFNSWMSMLSFLGAL